MKKRHVSRNREFVQAAIEMILLRPAEMKKDQRIALGVAQYPPKMNLVKSYGSSKAYFFSISCNRQVVQISKTTQVNARRIKTVHLFVLVQEC